MVKIIFIYFLIITTLYSAEKVAVSNPYEANCIKCHNSLSVSLEKIFFRYLVKYSSELSVKSAMIDFLKNPNKQTSAMSDEQIRRLGIKSKSHLSDEELKHAIDIYWERYKVFGKLW
jgi:hypothetical protein